MVRFAQRWRSFLDTPESAQEIEGFLSNPAYRIGDYFVGPSGWLTFNQFFAREVRPGKRPVAAPCDDSIVVSPADSIFKGHWPTDAQSEIEVNLTVESGATLTKGEEFGYFLYGGSDAYP